MLCLYNLLVVLLLLFFSVSAFDIGKGAVAGGAVIGLGALCYYGLGLSSQTGAIDHARYATC